MVAWALVLLVLMIINWIWTGDAIQVGTFAFAVLATLAGASLMVVLSRGRAIRRGPPEPSPGPEALPEASSGAVMAALGLASIVFGFVFGTFPIYFGAGVLIAGLGRIVIELRGERATRAAATATMSRERRP
jgi:hypothetical protein